MQDNIVFAYSEELHSKLSEDLDLQNKLQDSFKDFTKNNNIDFSKPIIVSYVDDKFYFRNQTEDSNLKVPAGEIKIPDAFFVNKSEDSLLSRDYYQKHLEDVWGF